MPISTTMFVSSDYVVFLLLALLLATSGQEPPASPDFDPGHELVLVNGELTVPFGRSVHLDPERHLKIAVGPGDRCRLRVLPDDPSTTGRLTPADFPCDYDERSVLYTHFGSRAPPSDRQRLLLRYDSADDTVIVPLTLRVSVTFDQQEVVTKNVPLLVDKQRGLSNPVDARTLHLTFDPTVQRCRLMVIRGPAIALPRYGQLVNYEASPDDGDGMTDCDDFLRGDVRYKHAPEGASPNRDYVPLVVELYDLQGQELQKQEYFQLTVRIKEARENTPPRVSDHSLLLMDVNQFVMTPITPDILWAQDAETPSEALLFNVTHPPGLGEGLLVSTDDPQQAVGQFSARDVQELKIAYRPPSSDSDVRRIFPLNLEVVDAEGLKSDSFTLLVTVNPMNTLAPVVTKNTGVSLVEGQSRRLQSSENLEISDEDNVDDVVVSVMAGGRHGQLMLLDAPVKRFSPADLDAGLIRYQHDGSDTTVDNIVFQMSDGRHRVHFLFPVTVFPADDQPPVLTVNTGLTLHKRLEAEITPFVLCAADTDSDDDAVTFELADQGPLYGQILLRRFVPPSPDDQRWTEVDGGGAYERGATRWTQQDINEGSVHYRHLGQHHSRTVLDAVTFRLRDDAEPPNVSKEKQFLVKILPLDDVPPRRHPAATLSLTVSEFQLTEFHQGALRYVDDDSDERLLRYAVVAPPADMDANSRSDAGRIVLSDAPDREVSTFTQAQVNHRKVAYWPPPVELGLTPREVQFEFQVEDEAGNVLTGQRFTISLQPLDNKPPRVFNGGFRVSENGFAPLDTQALDATDPDTDQQHLRFRLVALPRHGVLQRHSADMRLDDVFGRQELTNGSLAYVNDGADVEEDRFTVEISDGAHRIPATVRVSIRPVDDESPRLLTPGSLGVQLECAEKDGVVIGPEALAASDPDSDDRRLTFIVDRAPRYGHLVVNGRRVDRFTQGQLRQGGVSYQHNGDEIGLKTLLDAFSLSLSDMSSEWTVGGNSVNNIQVNVSIQPVDNVTPSVVLGLAFVVAEGQKKALGAEHLKVTDIDSEIAKLVCTVLKQPSKGYLENVAPAEGSERRRSGVAITAFRLLDLHRQAVSYVQSIHWGGEPRDDRFVLQCSDGVNHSPRIAFPVSIAPTNDERPLLTVGDFSVIEGMMLHVDKSILNATDADQPPDRLTFAVSKRPKHGKIVLQTLEGVTQVDRFTLKQLRNDGQSPMVAYAHDDSETTEDTFELDLLDGNPDHTVHRTVRVTILPTDDETPRLTINSGLQLDALTAAVITNRALKAEDLDSEDANLTFVVRAAPQHGYLEKKDPATGSHLMNLTNGGNFTQDDINLRAIVYHHTDQESDRDLIRLDVTDGINPLIDRHFHVSVQGVDEIHPDVVNRGVELPEGGRVTLTTDLLSTSDLNSADEALTFSVTRAPTRGHLEHADQPGFPVAAFTQLDLAGNKVQYVHTSDDEVKMDSFEFEVTDGFNSVFRTFRISLSDVDNKLPVLFLSKVVVKEGDHRVITPFELKVEDHDTPDERLEFAVVRMPLHGALLLNRSLPVSDFTMADLEQGLLGYQHDGSDTLRDGFTFTLTDGAHDTFFVFPNTDHDTRRPQTLEVEVTPVDNAVPMVVVNRGATSIGPLDDAGRAIGFRLTNKVLKAQDRDSPDADLLYVVSTPAQHGYLLHLAGNNDSITNFTQGDIDNMHVVYIFYQGENATSDIFTFKVVDQGGNELRDQTFRLNWAWISLEYDSYSVNETENYLRLNLRRRGYLGETSFVGVTTTDLTTNAGKDYLKSYARQVQFNPGQAEATWRLRILQDELYERIEQLQVGLEEPIMAVLEHPHVATVNILDDEDEPVVFFQKIKYEVEEGVGELLIPIQRKGDLSEELMVVCFTESDTATGTIPTTVLSYSDFISRADDQSNIVLFGHNESSTNCRIVIIDDSLYEMEERFQVRLSSATGGRIGALNSTEVVILPDRNDAAFFYFGATSYHVDESDGYLEVAIWRTGTDLSKTSAITVQSKPSVPPSAEAGKDYLGIGKTLEFGPAKTLQMLRIVILDDLGHPRLEGIETFQLVLRLPTNAIVGEPSMTTVTINDTISDLPKMQFSEANYVASENEKKVQAIITRIGDLSHTSTVKCYTRQSTAHVAEDFEERPHTNDSVVTFFPGEKEKPCTIMLIDDPIHENEEDFRLVLGNPESSTAGGALIGPQNFTRIIIKDGTDKPIIRFAKTHYNVREPRLQGEISTLEIPVVREGDLSRTSIVRIHTKDGSAKAGEDYNGISQDLRFGTNVSRLITKVEILHDADKEHREAFTINLKPDKNMVAEMKDIKAIIYIQEDDMLADVTFPSPPMVVSLRDYDEAASAAEHLIAGYPVVCITSCNPKHPDFGKTGTLCAKEGVNDSLTEFRWRVAAPNGLSGITNDWKDIDSSTFFASTKGITLDSIYFTGGSRVQCAARAVNLDGDPGMELLSKAITISKQDGICSSQILGSFGAEPFSSKLRYTGQDDPSYPNLVKLAVTMPHRDGMLPVISTSPLSHFAMTLSPDGARIGSHKCSNLLDFTEVKTRHGFITPSTKNPDIIGEVEPYQYSSELRSEPTLRFYRNLDLESCRWEFESYYNMSALITECGGMISTDGQALNLVQSFISVKVPLYVSYVFHSPVADGGWQHNDLQSQLQLTFVYDTSILWQNGISAPEESQLQAYLYPTSMKIQDDGRLVVEFRTEARFRGQFLFKHPETGLTSMVHSPAHDLSLALKLKRSEPTFAEPRQEWEFVSDYAIRDYSGMYHVKLLPCIAAEDAIYSSPPECNPQELILFEIQIRFQQVSDPVAAKYSLNTQFRLMRDKEFWLSDGEIGFDQDSDVAFQPGDTIYGRIQVDPVHNLGSSFHLGLERCFVCTGFDGYVPKYSPSDNEYGCIAQSSSLEHSFKIIDRSAPETVLTDFRNVRFRAVLVSEDEDPSVRAFVTRTGSDGFRLDSAPLFQVTHGRKWFLHCIYTIRSKESEALDGISKRSSETEEVRAYHSILSAQQADIETRRRSERSSSENVGIGSEGRGTNMRGIRLDFGESMDVDLKAFPAALLPAILGVALSLLVVTAVVLVVVKRRCERGPRVVEATVLKNGKRPVQSRGANGAVRVLASDARYCDKSQENTEV